MVNINQAQLDKMLAKGCKVTSSRSVAESLESQLAKQSKNVAKKGVNRNAMQKRSKDDPYRSQAEREYAALLNSEPMALGKEPHTIVARWAYEHVGLYLPDWGWFRPDFYLVTMGDKIHIHEIKGKGKYALTDKGKAKYLDAKRLYPEFDWKMIQRTATGWEWIM